MLRRLVAYVMLVVVVLAVSTGARAEDKYFDSAGVKIHYTIDGQGPPVVLVHGFTASIQVQWGLPGIITKLKPDYKVIALDNRGHGRSDKPHDPKLYGPESVNDVVRLLDHLKIEKAHVVGYSMGAFMTNYLVATHPSRVLTATLGGAAGANRTNADGRNERPGRVAGRRQGHRTADLGTDAGRSTETGRQADRDDQSNGHGHERLRRRWRPACAAWAT